MEYIGSVNFDLVELANWKAAHLFAGSGRISQLVTEIVEFKKRYDSLSRPDLRSQFSSVLTQMAVEFVYKTNVGESVGLQSKESTRVAIDEYFSDISPASEDKEKTETINIFRALEYIRDLREIMENSGKLSVEQICDLHRVLMVGLRDDAGEIRKHDVYTLYGKDKEIHFYPQPVFAEQIFRACVDHHCIQMSRLAKLSPEELLSTINVEFIFKRAARLLFDFVDAHPFGDGNGRTCRLLANYVISLITPFPVVPSCGEGKEMKENYLKAIIECRDHRDKGPGALASMLIEDTWRGWKKLFESFNQTQMG